LFFHAFLVRIKSAARIPRRTALDGRPCFLAEVVGIRRLAPLALAGERGFAFWGGGVFGYCCWCYLLSAFERIDRNVDLPGGFTQAVVEPSVQGAQAIGVAGAAIEGMFELVQFLFDLVEVGGEGVIEWGF
jgi:hypothetical protein